METQYHAEYLTALHLARIWKVLAMQTGLNRQDATDFAVQQAREYLQSASRYEQVQREGPDLIRKDIQSIEPSPLNPLKRLGHIDQS